jgi:membrane protease YdiL (CAAX protease family)
MTSLYLRRAHDSDRAIGPLTPDEVLEASPSAEDCLSLRATDPFVPIGKDLDRNDRLREALLEAFPSSRALRYGRGRLALFVSLVPVLLLALMDAEMLRAGREGAMAALAVDGLSALVVAVDLARPFPRHPHVTAAAFGAAAMRFVHLATLRCLDSSSVLMLGFALLAAAGSVAVLVAAPSPRAMADHVRAALAMAPPTILPPRTAPGFFRYIVYAICAAGLLPVVLWLLRSYETSLQLQLAVFAGFAVVVPYVGRVVVGREPPVHRDMVAGALGIPLDSYRADARVTLRALARAGAMGISCLVLSFALVGGCQSAVETVAAAQQCVAEEPTPLHRLLDAQRLEAGGPPSTRAPSWLLLTVLVVPIAEELVYRGLVQHALRRRLKRRVAIGLSATLFGLAHVVVFPMSVYQTVLLGLSFGVAYERAGIVASILTHMLWNLWLSM